LPERIQSCAPAFLLKKGSNPMGAKSKKLGAVTDGMGFLTPQSEERIHRFCTIATFLLVALILFCPLVMNVYADNPIGTAISSIKDSLSGNLDNLPRSMGKMIVTPITNDVVAQMDPAATGPVAVLFHWMTVDSKNSGDYWTNLYGEANAANAVVLDNAASVVELLGFAWMIVIAMGHLFSNLEKGMEAQEAVYRVLIEICIAGAFILNFDKFISLVIQIGQSLVSAFSLNNQVDTDDILDAYMQDMTGKAGDGMLDNLDIFWWIKAFGALVFPYIITMVTKVCAFGVMIETALELFVRRFLAPLALADIFQEGLRSPGMRFIKKIFGLFVKLAAVLVIASLISVLTIAMGTDISGHSTTYTVQLLAVNSFAVIAMLKCGAIADDVVGA
jgi:hypothetical protein